METPLGTAVEFLKSLGFFDVVLPFLLIFAILFGILEKTKIFGTEGGDKQIPKKNINAMIAFVIALFFISSKELVDLTVVSLPMVAIIAVIVVSVMMLAGFFFSSNEEFSFQKYGWLKGILVAFVLAGIIITFLYFAGWWDKVFGEGGYFSGRGNVANIWVGSIILVGVIIAALALITRSGGKSPSGGSS